MKMLLVYWPSLLPVIWLCVYFFWPAKKQEQRQMQKVVLPVGRHFINGLPQDNPSAGSEL